MLLLLMLLHLFNCQLIANKLAHKTHPPTRRH